MIGYIDTTTYVLVQDLKLAAASGAAQDSPTALGRRDWFIPQNLLGTTVLDIGSTKDGFDRSSLGAAYSDIVLNATGSLAESSCVRMQSDWIAGCERAYRVRHASPVRCSIHAMGRNSGRASSRGVYSRVLDTAESMLSSAVGP